MNFTQLENFVHLSSSLSFSKTATLNGTTQPSVSRQIRELESELGVSLFIRDKHSVRLSEAGQNFLRELKPWLTGFHAMIQNTKDQTERVSGPIRIACLPEIGKNYFFKKMLEFKNTYPEIDLQIQYQLHYEILNLLKNGEVDFGISIQPLMSENFRSYPVYAESAVLVTRNSCQLFSSVKSGKTKITELPFVGYSPVDALLNDYLKTFYSPADISKVKSISSVNAHQSMIDFLLNYDSFAVLPYFSVAQLVASKKLKTCGDKQKTNPFYLLETEKSSYQKKELHFRKFLLEAVKKDSSDRS